MHRHSPRAVPTQDRQGEQGERRLAAEHHDGPDDTEAIGTAHALHQGGATGDHEGGGQQVRARAGAFKQRPDHG